MDRQQREDELRELLTTQRGKEELLETLKKHAGIEAGNLPTFGTLLVQTILNYEYPETREPADQTVARAEADAAPEPEVIDNPEANADPDLVGASAATAPAARQEPGDLKFDQPPGQDAPGG